MQTLHLAAAPMSAFLLFAALPATAATSAASSTAEGIGAQFTAHGVATHLGPVGNVSGSAPPTYDNSATVSVFSGSVDITPSVAPAPTLFVKAAKIKVHVAGGIGLDTISADGEGSVGKTQLTLMLDPPPPGPVPEPFLAVVASVVKSEASFTDVLPDGRMPLGAARIGALTVSGSLVGDPSLGFSGSPKPNTVLFSSDQITITLNQQVVANIVECVQVVCRVIPVAITTHAVDIALTNANLDGHIVSGDIFIGGDEASVPLATAAE